MESERVNVRAGCLVCRCTVFRLVMVRVTELVAVELVERGWVVGGVGADTVTEAVAVCTRIVPAPLSAVAVIVLVRLELIPLSVQLYLTVTFGAMK